MPVLKFYLQLWAAYRVGIDAESVLRETNAKFYNSLRVVEQKAASKGKKLSELSREDIEMLWQPV
jgi:uncharacterized protein YabN with tetrapyrrole methylase and pyrophosphatase domain